MKKIISIIMLISFCFVALCSCSSLYTNQIIGEHHKKNSVYYESAIYMIVGGGTYEIKQDDGKLSLKVQTIGSSGEDYIGYNVGNLGYLEGCILSTANFDNIIKGGFWSEGYSAENIRKNAKAAWKTSGGEDTDNVYYIILTEEDDILMATIGTKDGERCCLKIIELG